MFNELFIDLLAIHLARLLLTAFCANLINNDVLCVAVELEDDVVKFLAQFEILKCIVAFLIDTYA
ncbi:hypothetical protein NEOLI_003908 [Neolecta irregularis DAH-3]|uniref:Uncharacterized protein n=1 Tax=Neolecta irregularis (strain DAH-3) TaxID=1198029 RepID=A0A1U7LHG8_NEOID|nr:hypothetical protein NEOLI_003908 [Neolecta irregularis DAH-3]|eukprot:OLL21971.1 hypothetical protein NEOLI_003908 [Neolecta irregularis DAH-3]